MADTSTVKLMLELQRLDESPLRSEWTRVAVADETLTALVVRPSTSGETVDLSAFSSIDTVVVRNRSQLPSESVRLEYTYNEFRAVYDIVQLRFNAGTSVDQVLQGTTYTGDPVDFFYSDYRVGSRLRISNTDNAANSGSFTLENIDNAGGTRLEFNTNAGFVTQNEPKMPIFEQDHLLSVPVPAGAIHIANRVYTPDNLLLTSASGTPKCDIWVLGT